MGNSSSQTQNTERHKRLGQVQVQFLTNKQGDINELMTLKRTLRSEKQYQDWTKQITRIEDSMTRQVIMLPTSHFYEKEGMCGSSGVATITFQHFPYVFQTQIENRRRIHRYFLQTQLWYLLYSLVLAGSKFQKYHSKIGDVHPANILINNDGLVKLISTCSLPAQQNNFQKLVDNPNATVFLAPQELANHCVKIAQYPNNIDPSAAECYSIGLVLLAAGTLEDIDSVYATQNGERQIQRQKVNYYLKLFGQRYSSYLHSTIMGLLVDTPLQRKKCSQIYSSLLEYEEKILNLDSFMPNHSRFVPIPASQGPILASRMTMPAPQLIRSNASPQKIVNVAPVQYLSVLPGRHVQTSHVRPYPLVPGQMPLRSSQVIYREHPQLPINSHIAR